jgi:hypothetical protein
MPAQPFDATARTALVNTATAAPCLHDAQPWRLRSHSGSRTFELTSPRRPVELVLVLEIL